MNKRTKPKIKVLAVSSTGGHWIQMRRLRTLFEKYNTVYVCTATKSIPQRTVYKVKDASRWNKLGLIKQLFQVLYIIVRERPSVVLSTGASIGVWAIIFGRMLGCKAIWLDSIANYSEISLSGRVVKPFCSSFLTQWKHLASDSIMYKGSIL